jgi:hypothetical protein
LQKAFQQRGIVIASLNGGNADPETPGNVVDLMSQGDYLLMSLEQDRGEFGFQSSEHQANGWLSLSARL